MKFIDEWILNPKFWLPENYSWIDIVSKDPNFYYGEPKDLYYSFYTAIVIYFFRVFIEKCIWCPIGKTFGLSYRKYYKADSNNNLEIEYKFKKRPNDFRIKEISKMYSLDEKYLQRWFRRRRNQNKSDILTKFTESGWRFTFYLTIFIVGCWILSDQSFIWDTSKMWIDVPYFNITPSMFWYIMVELGYYWASLLTVFYDVKRKDFWEMFIHHLVTIFLICLAWIQNFIGVSLYVLCLHDFVDYFMEAAKMMKYIKKNSFCNVLFIIFMVAWFVSRLVIYPIKILHSAFIHLELNHFGVRLCQFFLCILQILHIMWFVMIVRIALQAFDDTGTLIRLAVQSMLFILPFLCVNVILRERKEHRYSNKIHKDSRSDSDMSLSEDNMDSKNNNSKKSR